MSKTVFSLNLLLALCWMAVGIMPCAPAQEKIGGGVAEQHLIDHVHPAYPALARRAGIQGDVLLNLTIGTAGSVESIKVISGHPRLVPAAIVAVKQWRYKPFIIDGNAVRVSTEVKVRFRLAEPVEGTAAEGNVLPLSSKQRARSYTLDGVVKNALTGEPISGAKVQINGRFPEIAFSGPDGKFRFENINHSRVSLQVQKHGFLWEQEPTHWFPEFIRVANLDAVLPQAVVKLLPAATITGHAVDSNGSPIPHLGVGLFRSYVWDGEKIVRTNSGTETDAQGQFRFEMLPPGTYYLRSADSYRGPDPDGKGYPATYYPTSRDLESATPLTVVPGQKVEVDFRIPRGVFYRVSGRVEGLSQGSRYSVWFTGPDGQTHYRWDFRFPFPDPMGRFSASLPAGPYDVRAYTEGTYDVQGVVVRRVNVNSDISNLILTTSPLITLPVHVQPSWKKLSVVLLTKMNGLFAGKSWGASVVTDGIFEIRNLEPGTYRAMIRAHAPWYVASAKSGETNLLAEDLTVSASTPVKPIEIDLRDDFAAIEGNVLFNEQPTSGVVLLIPKSRPRQAVTIPIGPTGEFQTAKLPPGEYSAYALDHVDELEYASPEIMGKYEPGKRIIRVPPNGHATVNLDLQKF